MNCLQFIIYLTLYKQNYKFIYNIAKLENLSSNKLSSPMQNNYQKLYIRHLYTLSSFHLMYALNICNSYFLFFIGTFSKDFVSTVCSTYVNCFGLSTVSTSHLNILPLFRISVKSRFTLRTWTMYGLPEISLNLKHVFKILLKA